MAREVSRLVRCLRAEAVQVNEMAGWLKRRDEFFNWAPVREPGREPGAFFVWRNSLCPLRPRLQNHRQNLQAKKKPLAGPFSSWFLFFLYRSGRCDFFTTAQVLPPQCTTVRPSISGSRFGSIPPQQALQHLPRLSEFSGRRAYGLCRFL